MPRKLTNEQEVEIIEMYKNGLNSVRISKIMNVSSSTIQKKLKVAGITLNGSAMGSIKVNIDEQTKSKIVEFYLSGMSSIKIIKELSLEGRCCDNTIRKLAMNAGVKIRKRGYFSRIENENFFEEIDSEIKAYFLGLIITDGYIIKNKTKKKNSAVLGIELKESDKYILERFAKIFYENKSLAYKPSKKTYMLTIYSNKLCEDLAKFGVVPRKTNTVRIPDMNNEVLQRHLVRGIFDGDGTVFISKGVIKFGLYGNKQTVGAFRDLLETRLNANRVKITDKTTVQQITYASRKDVLSFYNFIYQDATIYLLRKKELFESKLC